MEPSAPMLEVCRRRAEEAGITARCEFHEGYVEALPPGEAYEAATSLLVSQFILDPEPRSRFFQAIAERLRPGGYLVTADLSAGASDYESILEAWLRMMRAIDVPQENLERLRAAYGRDVAVVPPDEVRALLVSGGFHAPVQFLQTGLIHAWYARKPS